MYDKTGTLPQISNTAKLIESIMQPRSDRLTARAAPLQSPGKQKRRDGRISSRCDGSFAAGG